MARDFVELKIDVERHTHGAEVAARLRAGSEKGGIPWMTIVDAKGERLATSDAPEGNVGCPVTDGERAWFMKMLTSTKQNLTDEELATIESELATYAATIR